MEKEIISDSTFSERYIFIVVIKWEGAI